MDADETGPEGNAIPKNDDAAVPAPPMNRAERRAAAHNKPSTHTGAGGSPFGTAGTRGVSARGAAGPGKSRLPRTGHK